MDKQTTTPIPISSIILDEDIYPQKGIDHRRVGMFAENIREGFSFDPVEVEAVPDLSQGFTAAHVAEKHGWPKPMVWSLALDGKDDRKDFRNFAGVRTWDLWDWNNCDKRFGLVLSVLSGLFGLFGKMGI